MPTIKDAKAAWQEEIFLMPPMGKDYKWKNMVINFICCMRCK
jgi:hypothetical protein